MNEPPGTTTMFPRPAKLTSNVSCVHSPTFPRKTSDKQALDKMADRLGTGRAFFAALKDSPDDTRYAVLASPLSHAHQIGDGEPPECWNVTVELIEARG